MGRGMVLIFEGCAVGCEGLPPPPHNAYPRSAANACFFVDGDLVESRAESQPESGVGREESAWSLGGKFGPGRGVATPPQHILQVPPFVFSFHSSLALQG